MLTDNLTGLTETKEITNEGEIGEIPSVQLPTAEERLQALEQAMLEIVLGGAI